MLRDAEGTVHVFSNGAITTLANRSKDFSYVIDLPISYREDPDRVAAVLKQIAPRCRPIRPSRRGFSSRWKSSGVDAFRDWSVVLKMRIKTVPLKQWDVGREFRKRIRRRFNEKGSRFPIRCSAPTRCASRRRGVDRRQ